MSTGPAGPANAVNVRFGIVWEIVIDDMTNSLHIQPSCGHVSRNQHIQAARLQMSNRAFTLILRNFAVQRCCGKTPLTELIGYLNRCIASLYKHDYAIGFLAFQNLSQRIEFGAGLNQNACLFDRVRSRSIALDGDRDRFLQMFLRDPLNGRWHRSGEQQDLTFCRKLFQNPLDVVNEPHPQHFIPFIEDKGRQI